MDIKKGFHHLELKIFGFKVVPFGPSKKEFFNRALEKF